MKKYLLRLTAGLASLAVAAPAFAMGPWGLNEDVELPTPSQECVAAMAEVQENRLANFETHMAARKEAMTVHLNGLRNAMTIEDETERAAALKQANENARTIMQNALPSQEERDAQREALQAACGDNAFFGMGMMGFGHMGMRGPGGDFGLRDGTGPRLEHMAELLNMTEDELQAELDNGKTIPEIAEEQGVELPAPPNDRGMGRGFHRWEPTEGDTN